MNYTIQTIQSTAKSSQAKVLVVSKYRSNEDISILYNMGFRHMGENRVQSLMDKKDDLPKDIRWHIIGPLQRNKVKYIAEFVELIHSVDSIKLAKEINKEAKKHNRIIPILLQFKVAKEDSKQGISPEDKAVFIEELSNIKLDNISIHGIMGMGTFTKDEEQVRAEFKELKTLFDDLKASAFANNPNFNTLSMGMSGDYKIALEEGSTMLRLGSILFNNI